MLCVAKTKGAVPGTRPGTRGAAPARKVTAKLARAGSGRPATATHKTTAARTARKPAAARAATSPAADDRAPATAGRASKPARGSTRATRSVPTEPGVLRDGPDDDASDAPGEPNNRPVRGSARGASRGDDEPVDRPDEPNNRAARASARGDLRSLPTKPGVLRGGPDEEPVNGAGVLGMPSLAAPDDDKNDENDDDDRDDGAVAGEPLATRDIARLLRYGERIGSDKIDVRMLPLQFHARSGALAVCDPGRPETWRVLERTIGNGAFRVMLSVARPAEDAATGERLAAVVIHVGRPPIARWTVAQVRDLAAAPDAVPTTPVTGGWLALVDAGDGSPGVIALPPPTGVMPVEVPLTDGRRALAVPCGNGAFAAYWALDADDRPICAVIDFNAFTQKAWRAKPPPG